MPRHTRPGGALLLFALLAVLLTGASHRTDNFMVTAPRTDLARTIAEAAEKHRSRLALEWLGAELPDWPAPCPIWVRAGARLPPSGSTSYVFRNGKPFDWEMELSGAPDALLECVLPHEVMHTILATHFGRPLPRWADEGFCTIVEPARELTLHHHRTLSMLRLGRTMPLAQLFQMEHYPRDPIPFYTQSYSISNYLVATGGRQTFVQFLAAGSRSGNWTAALESHYGVKDLAILEDAWKRSLVAPVPASGETVGQTVVGQ